MRVYSNNGVDWSLSVRLGTDSDYYKVDVSLPEDPRGKDYRYVVTIDTTSTPDIKVYQNGDLLTGTATTTVGSPSGPQNSPTQIGLNWNGVKMLGQPSDFMYNNIIYTINNIQLISNGYKMDDASVHLGLNNDEAGVIKNYGTDGNAHDGQIFNGSAMSNQYLSYTTGNFPIVKAVTGNQGSPDTYLNLYMSPPSNGGRSEDYQKYRQVIGKDFGGVSEIDFTYNAKSLIGNNPGASYYYFYVQQVDKLTGAKNPSGKGKKSAVKFKAGSDLSSSVN